MTDVVSRPRPADADSAEPRPRPPAPPPAAPPNDVGVTEAPAPVRHWWLGLPATILGLFMVALDQSLTGVAFGAIGTDLGASTIDTQWVTTLNRIGQAIAIPAAAYLCGRFGVVRMYVVSMLLFIVFSTGCALSTNLWMLAAFRFLEGFPGGILSLACIGLLVTTVPMGRIPAAVPILQAFALSAPGFGPVIGGLLVLDVQWRAVFWTTVGLAVVGLMAALLIPRAPQGKPQPPFDLAGFACLAGAVVALTLAVSKGNDWGWTSYPIVVLSFVAVDLAALWVIIGRQREHPLLNLAMFADRTFAVGCVLTAVIGVELASTIGFIPTFLKSVQGLSATVAGIVMIPSALTLITAVVTANFLVRSVGLQPVMFTGLVVLGTGTLLLTRITVDMPREELAGILAIRSLGLGLAFVPILMGATSGMQAKGQMLLVLDAIKFRTIIQRILGALVITLFTEFAAHRQRQILNDQGGLLSPANQPGLYAENQSNPDALVSLWNQLKSHGTAQSYSEVFVVVALACFASLVLVVFTRWGKPPPRDDVVIRDGA